MVAKDDEDEEDDEDEMREEALEMVLVGMGVMDLALIHEEPE